MAHSEESRLANLLRRVSREEDRDRRLATLRQLRDFITHSDNKVVREQRSGLLQLQSPGRPSSSTPSRRSPSSPPGGPPLTLQGGLL